MTTIILEPTVQESFADGGTDAKNATGAAPVSQPTLPDDDTASFQTECPVLPNDNKHLLELQLMNRWSTVTYRSMCTPVAKDDYVWQIKVPSMAINFDFLMNGLLAITAFEIGSTFDNAPYVHAAVEYQTLAIGSFRKQLQDVHPNMIEPILCFSLMLMVLALASAQCRLSSRPSVPTEPHNASASSSPADADMVASTFIHFELLRGCGVVLEGHAQYLAESPYIRRLKRFEELPLTALDPAMESAITKLTEANEARIISSVGEPYEHRVKQIAHWEVCKKAISLLRECFAKCANEDYCGYVLGWLNMAGEDYINAIKDNDNVALLVLVYWGVLIQTLGHQVWWARHYGRLLANEISSRRNANVTEPDPITDDLILLAREFVNQTARSTAV